MALQASALEVAVYEFIVRYRFKCVLTNMWIYL